MADLSNFNPNSVSNPNNNIFGLPFTEEEAAIVLLPIPWDVTASYNAGTARSAEHIVQAALQVDLFDSDGGDEWRKGFFIKPIDKKILLKSDYLRKEAELYIDYISKGGNTGENKFMNKSLKDINEGSNFLNNWVLEQTKQILAKNKFVVLVGGDHSTSFGYIKALAEKHQNFGILQIDAHCDLRKAYENFTYSHASIMYNVLSEIPEVTKLIQVGVRDYCEEESIFIKNNENRVAITPAGVVSFVKSGHEVMIEKNAGIGSGFSNEEYKNAGAKITDFTCSPVMTITKTASAPRPTSAGQSPSCPPIARNASWRWGKRSAPCT